MSLIIAVVVSAIPVVIIVGVAVWTIVSAVLSNNVRRD